MTPELARVLARLAEELPAGHVEAWARVLRGHRAPDAGLEARLIEAGPGFAVGARAARLARAWREAVPRPAGEALALALETGAVSAARYAGRQSDVVVSGPVGDHPAVRLTGAVVTEIIRDSASTLLVVSFAAFGVIEVVRELREAAERGVRVDLVLEGSREKGGTLRGDGAAAAFTALHDSATFWSWPARHRPAGAARAALHAKLVAADDRVAFLGSANLTDRALADNIELGVVIRDPAVVRRMVGHFRGLMRPGEGPLEPVRR
ncbi:DISARM system phospholipase D-like protein DrmC [Actinomadura macra]|uniref:DISARM system phospholipase D-like protein DrmC n=1 Tax=Actinomadura macra TaxID=46164 RepID=UPI000830A57D|nr:DISARM system phospholipase D-like protein DrmC [Actinomadura macra]